MAASAQEWTPPRRKTGSGTARGVECGPQGGKWVEVACTLDTRCKDGAVRNQVGMLCMAHGQGAAEIMAEHASTLNCNHEAPIVCRESGPGFWQEDKAAGTVKTNGSEPSTAICFGIAENIIGRKPDNGGNGAGFNQDVQFTLNRTGVHGVCGFTKNDAGRDASDNIAPTLRSGGSGNSTVAPAVAGNTYVRRLTPVECERLMGFPDGHTQIPWRGKRREDCPDTPRYKACGNSQCVNVMRWLGMRIEMIDKL